MEQSSGSSLEGDKLHIPADIKASLVKYAYAERKLQENPLIREMITWRSLANHILRNEVQKRGFYTGKVKAK